MHSSTIVCIDGWARKLPSTSNIMHPTIKLAWIPQHYIEPAHSLGLHCIAVISFNSKVLPQLLLSVLCCNVTSLRSCRWQLPATLSSLWRGTCTHNSKNFQSIKMDVEKQVLVHVYNHKELLIISIKSTKVLMPRWRLQGPFAHWM